MRHQYQKILLLIYVARKMVYLHTAVSRACFLISWRKRLVRITGFPLYISFREFPTRCALQILFFDILTN